MIPVRTRNDTAPPAQTLSVTDRLQRLRFEQRNSSSSTPRQQQQRPSQAGPSSLPAHLALLALDPRAGAPQTTSGSASSTHGAPTSRFRGTAGPAAPRSWLEAESERVVRSPQERRAVALPVALVPLEEALRHQQDSRAQLAPLPANARRLPSLAELCGRVIVSDLARGRRASVLLEFVRWLPLELRVPLLEIAPTRCAVGLGASAIREILSELGSDEDDSDGADDGARSAAGTVADGPGPASGNGPASDSDDEAACSDEEEWERASITSQAPPTTLASSLTSLNLSLSTLSLSSLSALLLTPPTPSRPSPRPRFPHLLTLTLTGMPRLTLSTALLSTLSQLLSLRSLSLALLPFAAEGDGALTPLTLLPRLAGACPNLTTLDLSFVEELSQRSLELVDWDIRWKVLAVVGWRGFVDERGEGGGSFTERALRAKRVKLAQELWGAVKRTRKHQGRYITFVT